MRTHLAGGHEGVAEDCEIACLACNHPCRAHLLGTRCNLCQQCKSFLRQSNGMDAWPITISCVMITCQPRLVLARRAIAAFERQSYPFKELVIASEDDVSTLDRPFHRIPMGLTLGDKRNFAIARARGYYVAIWDDNDIHAPERLMRQMEAIARSPTEVDGCVLSNVTLARPRRDRFAISQTRQWENTLVGKRWRMPSYPAMEHGSDTPVVEAMKIVLVNDSTLLTREEATEIKMSLG